MTEFRRYIRISILLSVTLILCLGCSPSSKISNGTPKPEENRFATSESALSSDKSDSDKGDFEIPPGYGDQRIEYDHQFTYDMKMDGIGLWMQVVIKDYVPLQTIAAGLGTSPLFSNGKRIENYPYFQLFGENELKVDGTGLFTIGEETCSCEFSDKIDVAIEGVTHPGKLHSDASAETIFISVAFNETWYTNPQWTCDCDDSHKNVIAQLLQDSIPSGSPPELYDKTLRFQYDCSGHSRIENMMASLAPVAKGTYQWTWKTGSGENKENPITPIPPDSPHWDEDHPPIICGVNWEPVWGPAISTIESGLGITEWHDQ